MTNAIEQSPLWRQTFAKSLADPSVSRLVTSLRNARERVAHLTSRIVASLPGLTLHDSSHLDALWGVASTIVGDDYVLNPLEGYLFGTAVLLHDAALCYEAYSGGQEAVRETTQWRDAYNRCQGRSKTRPPGRSKTRPLWERGRVCFVGSAGVAGAEACAAVRRRV